MTEGNDGFVLTQERRRAVCVHEAAHAVVTALTGGHVYRLQVAPVCVTSFEAESRKGGIIQDIWGSMSTSDLYIRSEWLKWDAENYEFSCDRGKFESFWRAIDDRTLTAQRALLRKHICMLLAGDIAQNIHDVVDWDIWRIWDQVPNGPGDDSAKAIGLARLLPWCNELECMFEQTEAALKTPRVWAHVVAVADELERLGDMDDLYTNEALLPDAVEGWPASPRGRPVSV